MSALAAGVLFICTPVSVWDGDGPIACEEGQRVRLAGIAAREIDGTCNANQPCPEASGEAARDALVQLVGTPTGRGPHGHVLVRATAPLNCRSAGPDRYDRTVAWCASPAAGDLSCALVTARVALPWPRYDGASVCRRF